MGINPVGNKQLANHKYQNMKKNIRIKRLLFLPIAYCLLSIASSAQTDSVKIKHKIAIFAPLYIDSAFGPAEEYRYAKNVLPKFINPGLEFYEGAQLALDSLSKEGKEMEVYVYDTRSAA